MTPSSLAAGLLHAASLERLLDLYEEIGADPEVLGLSVRKAEVLENVAGTLSPLELLMAGHDVGDVVELRREPSL